MDNANTKQQIVDRIKQATNVLVTVNVNPTVDQLAACVGLTLLLNKLGKHATAVFSGDVPSTIEFLQPEKTLEKNTDSLRDFIIALDKSKADKLRYKVEDKVVKIFITPYRTSISEKDLDFSQGDFNVDVVLALGVHQQADLDQAITEHGRILHDATVISINNTANGNLGSINWVNASVSSLSELVVLLGDELNKNVLDGQIATALLTGIVAETNRFSNNKTTPQTMSVSSRLMAAGANQQLVATKLEPPKPPPPVPTPAPAPTPHPNGQQQPPAPKDNDGTLEISHADKPTDATGDTEDSNASSLSQIDIDDEGTLLPITQDTGNPNSPIPATQPPPGPGPTPGSPAAPTVTGGSRIMLQPPVLGGTLTANSNPEPLDPSNDALSLPQVEPPSLNHDPSTKPIVSPLPATPQPSTLPPPTSPGHDKTLSELEQAVDSPHAEDTGSNNQLNDARSAVQAAVAANSQSQPLPPIQALNARPMLDNQQLAAPPPDNALNMPLPTGPPVQPQMTPPPPDPGVPPVPPPMTMPPAPPQV